MKLNKHKLKVLSFIFLNWVENIAIIILMWKVSPILCTIISGLTISKWMYINLNQHFEVKGQLAEYKATMDKIQAQKTMSHQLDNVTAIKGPIQ